MFKTLGVIRDGPHLDPVTKMAYQYLEDNEHRENTDHSPHGAKWFTSFHASQFPGGVDDKRCGRKTLYTMMDIPMERHFKPENRAIMLVGKEIERQIVYRWGRVGRTIGGSVPIHGEYGPMEQIKFEDPDYWLTGSCDAVLDIRPRWHAVLPVDVKGKDQAAIDKMDVGAQSYEPYHYLQIQCYIYFCRKYHVEMGWADLGLAPAEGGILYYVSRQRPRNTHEFYIEYDEDFVLAGLERLDLWQTMYVGNELPVRPKDWKWTEDPCKWCDFKKLCKADVKAEVKTLTDSHTITHAKRVRNDYDAEANRQEVLDRWNSK
jgi:hypothetical protein